MLDRRINIKQVWQEQISIFKDEQRTILNNLFDITFE